MEPNYFLKILSSDLRSHVGSYGFNMNLREDTHSIAELPHCLFCLTLLSTPPTWASQMTLAPVSFLPFQSLLSFHPGNWSLFLPYLPSSLLFSLSTLTAWRANSRLVLPYTWFSWWLVLDAQRKWWALESGQPVWTPDMPLSNSMILGRSASLCSSFCTSKMGRIYLRIIYHIRLNHPHICPWLILFPFYFSNVWFCHHFLGVFLNNFYYHIHL